MLALLLGSFNTNDENEPLSSKMLSSLSMELPMEFDNADKSRLAIVPPSAPNAILSPSPPSSAEQNEPDEMSRPSRSGMVGSLATNPSLSDCDEVVRGRHSGGGAFQFGFSTPRSPVGKSSGGHRPMTSVGKNGYSMRYQQKFNFSIR